MQGRKQGRECNQISIFSASREGGVEYDTHQPCGQLGQGTWGHSGPWVPCATGLRAENPRCPTLHLGDAFPPYLRCSPVVTQKNLQTALNQVEKLGHLAMSHHF